MDTIVLNDVTSLANSVKVKELINVQDVGKILILMSRLEQTPHNVLGHVFAMITTTWMPHLESVRCALTSVITVVDQERPHVTLTIATGQQKHELMVTLVVLVQLACMPQKKENDHVHVHSPTTHLIGPQVNVKKIQLTAMMVPILQMEHVCLVSGPVLHVVPRASVMNVMLHSCHLLQA